MSVQQKAGVVLPAACAVAASFDPALARSVGAAQGQAEVDPNIKRSPLCGRNFAMFSEDPHLTAALAAAVVGGAQNAVVGPLLCCSQVTDAPDRRVDERTLQEIYLPPAAASLQAGPQGVRYGSGTLNGGLSTVKNASCSTWAVWRIPPSGRKVMPNPLAARLTEVVLLVVYRASFGSIFILAKRFFMACPMT